MGRYVGVFEIDGTDLPRTTVFGQKTLLSFHPGADEIDGRGDGTAEGNAVVGSGVGTELGLDVGTKVGCGDGSDAGINEGWDL